MDVMDVGFEGSSPIVAAATEPHTASRGLSLLRACRLINREATPVFYGALTVRLMVGDWDPHDTQVSRVGDFHYLVRKAQTENSSIHRLWSIESVGAFKHLRQAEIRIGLFGGPQLQGDNPGQQASVPIRVGQVVRCLNAAPQLKAVGMHILVDTVDNLAAHTASMAAVSRVRTDFEIRATMVALDSEIGQWQPGHDEASQAYHDALEAIGG